MKQSTKNKIGIEDVTAKEWNSVKWLQGEEEKTVQEDLVNSPAQYKNGIEDLKKAEWYENKLLEVLGSDG